jgi:beta-galactosidase/beta-glucuronidase
MDRAPRPEYPRPQLVRPRWRSLNGPWQLAFDASDRGLRDGWERGRPFEQRIQVPFPIGAPLSGVVAPEPPPRIWYRRELDVRAEELGPRTRVYVGACDFDTRVFVNGRDVGRHRGGYTPVVCEAGHALRAGANEIVLRVEDRDTWTQPRGKQAAGAFRTPVDYDPVVGVWQSVWLEPLPEVSIDEVWTRWSAASGELAVHVAFSEPWSGEVEVALFDGASELARERGGGLGRPEARVPLRLSGPRLWSPSDPHLHSLEVTLLVAGGEADRVTSPCGVRELGRDGGRVLLNGAPLYLRGVLDQGYFPGGWYAAASDADLRRDVELVRSLGFNCARKHQKLEDPRWLHWADRLGLLVWSEMPSGRDFSTALVSDLAREWTEAVRRDRGHACIVAWVPFNESWGAWNQARRPEERAFVEGVAGLTRALDPTRLIVANDGWEYAAGDLWTLHLYEGESEGVRERLAALLADPHAAVLPQGHLLGERVGALPDADVSGLPVLLTECGGIGFAPGEAPATGEPAFAYGELPKTEAELESRIRAAAEVVTSCSQLAGFVWTQLCDVQQEINGLVSFERRPKLPVERLAAIFSRIGASG